MDGMECPNCGREASIDYYYKTGEEYINCGNCGYHRSATIVNRDKLLTELTDDDWKVEEVKNPYGAYRLKQYNSVAYQCGLFGDEEQYTKFRNMVNQDDDIEFWSVSRLVDGEIVVEYSDDGRITDEINAIQAGNKAVNVGDMNYGVWMNGAG